MAPLTQVAGVAQRWPAGCMDGVRRPGQSSDPRSGPSQKTIDI